MDSIINLASHGIGGIDYALFANRLALGVFFTFSGFHKLFNAKRHATLIETLRVCGVPFLPVMQWFVPAVEFTAGVAVALGFLAPFFALGIVAICLVATCTDGVKRIAAWAPIDAADRVDDVLYLPEVLYILQAIVVICGGVGAHAVL